jgi:flagellar protein FliJ
MAKFVFKMQSLLNIKTQMEESLKNELGKAVQKLELEKNKLKKIEIDKDECINNLKSKSSKGIIVSKIQEYNSYISLLKERMKIQKENINYAQNIVDKYREQLIKMMQEKEMLEKLKDKKYQEYLLEQAKAEQKINDEVISYKYSKVIIEN